MGTMADNKITWIDFKQNLDENDTMREDRPYAYIVEQPAKCGVRFRYECEGRIASAIPGIHSSVSYTSYPTLSVSNYSGPIKVIVSCVTANEPHRPHPHNLVGRRHCHDGVCEIVFPDSSFCQFTDLGIVCAKRKDIRERLRVRECLQVNPFKTNGFPRDQSGNKEFDLTAVRLCFQVYILDSATEKLTFPLEPIVSNEIYDKKAMSDLTIYRLSHTSAPVSGGQTAIILCDRVNKEDVQIRFYLFGPTGLLWESYAAFQSEDVHKHFAISFPIPAFSLPFVDKSLELVFNNVRHIPVNVQLVRPSDGTTSEPVTFNYFYSMNESSVENTLSDALVSQCNDEQTNELYLSTNYLYPIPHEQTLHPPNWMQA